MSLYSLALHSRPPFLTREFVRQTFYFCRKENHYIINKCFEYNIYHRRIHQPLWLIWNFKITFIIYTLLICAKNFRQFGKRTKKRKGIIKEAGKKAVFPSLFQTLSIFITQNRSELSKLTDNAKSWHNIFRFVATVYRKNRFWQIHKPIRLSRRNVTSPTNTSDPTYLSNGICTRSYGTNHTVSDRRVFLSFRVANIKTDRKVS